MTSIYLGAQNHFNWNFGDGTPTVTTRVGEVRHSFKAKGAVTMQLTITNPLASSTVTLPVTVFEAVTLGAVTGGSPQGSPAGTPVDMLVEVKTGTVLTFEWFIDDQLIHRSHSEAYRHTFPTSGTYNVSVKVSNDVSFAVAFAEFRITSQITGKRKFNLPASPLVPSTTNFPC